MEVTISRHATKRIKSRMGIPKKATLRQFSRALDRGIKQSDAKGNLRKYLASIALKEERPHSVVVYNSYVFIYGYSEGIPMLITVIPLPSNLQREVKYYKN